MSAHQFALFVEQIPSRDIFDISEGDLVRRITQVLRSDVGDELVLFDGNTRARVVIRERAKKHISVGVLTREKSVAYAPEIVWLLPVLEREQMEAALYALAATGINTIQVVTTDQSRSIRWGDKDYERAHRIMISACEQAKNFVMPELKQPVALEEALKIYAHHKPVVFDASGKNFAEISHDLNKQYSLLCITGPEAGFSDSELAFFKEKNMSISALTPTILKASHAVLVGAGMLRSWLR